MMSVYDLKKIVDGLVANGKGDLHVLTFANNHRSRVGDTVLAGLGTSHCTGRPQSLLLGNFSKEGSFSNFSLDLVLPHSDSIENKDNMGYLSDGETRSLNVFGVASEKDEKTCSEVYEKYIKKHAGKEFIIGGGSQGKVLPFRLPTHFSPCESINLVLDIPIDNSPVRVINYPGSFITDMGYMLILVDSEGEIIRVSFNDNGNAFDEYNPKFSDRYDVFLINESGKRVSLRTEPNRKDYAGYLISKSEDHDGPSSLDKCPVGGEAAFKRLANKRSRRL